MDHTTAEQVAEVLRRQYPGLEVKAATHDFGSREGLQIRFDAYRHALSWNIEEQVEPGEYEEKWVPCDESSLVWINGVPYRAQYDGDDDDPPHFVPADTDEDGVPGRYETVCIKQPVVKPYDQPPEKVAFLVTGWLVQQTGIGDAARAVLKGWKKLQEEAPPRVQRPVDPPPGPVVRGRPLTEGQLKTLPVGTPIVVTWPGCDRSGYPYLLAFDDEGGPCAAGVRGPGGGTLYVKRLNALGDGPPWTVVWVP